MCCLNCKPAIWKYLLQSSKCFLVPFLPRRPSGCLWPWDGMLMSVSGWLPCYRLAANGLIKKLWAQNQSWYKPGVKLVKLLRKFHYLNASNLQPFAVQQTDCSCYLPPAKATTISGNKLEVAQRKNGSLFGGFQTTAIKDLLICMHINGLSSHFLSLRSNPSFSPW